MQNKKESPSIPEWLLTSLIWVIGILVITVTFISAFKMGECENFTRNIMNTLAILSIVLAVLAIIISAIQSRQAGDRLHEISSTARTTKDASEKLGQNVNKIIDSMHRMEDKIDKYGHIPNEKEGKETFDELRRKGMEKYSDEYEKFADEYEKGTSNVTLTSFQALMFVSKIPYTFIAALYVIIKSLNKEFKNTIFRNENFMQDFDSILGYIITLKGLEIVKLDIRRELTHSKITPRHIDASLKLHVLRFVEYLRGEEFAKLTEAKQKLLMVLNFIDKEVD